MLSRMSAFFAANSSSVRMPLSRRDASCSSRSSGSREADALERLEHLASLRDKGILTDDEFAAKKADILESM